MTASLLPIKAAGAGCWAAWGHSITSVWALVFHCSVSWLAKLAFQGKVLGSPHSPFLTLQKGCRGYGNLEREFPVVVAGLLTSPGAAQIQLAGK